MTEQWGIYWTPLHTRVVPDHDGFNHTKSEFCLCSPQTVVRSYDFCGTIRVRKVVTHEDMTGS